MESLATIVIALFAGASFAIALQVLEDAGLWAASFYFGAALAIFIFAIHAAVYTAIKNNRE